MTRRFGGAPETTKLIGIGLIGVAALLVGGVVAILTQGPSAQSRAAVVATTSPSSTEPVTTSSADSSVTDSDATPPSTSPADQGGNQDTGTVPDDGRLPTDNSARVTRAGDGLRMRTQPGLGGGSEALLPLLPAGTRVFVVDGPEHSDGYDWYQVVADSVDFRLFGWVAAGSGGEHWLVYAPRTC
jgi:hypothetical protein